MKRLIFIFLLIPYLLCATDYYVSNAGSNGNSGTTTGTPWETLSKVNSSSFFPGDKILFRRGDTFRGYLVIPSSGSIGSPITIGAYSAGVKPKILGSLDRSSTSNWTNYSGNIWRTATIASPLYDAGNIIFNDDASCGVKHNSLVGCTSQGNWYYNITDERVYMYSVGNPGTYYSHIELGGIYSENIVTVNNHDYITIENLDVKYSANNGIFISESDNVIVQNCDISWIGGMYYGGYDYGMGNGIQMWDNVNYITVRYNYIHDTYDTGISPQGDGTYTQTNVLMYYNVFKNCYWTYEIFVGGTGSRTLTNIHFQNNTCMTASSWSEFWRPDVGRATHVKTWDENNAVRTNLTIKNNIFYVSNYTGLTHYYTNVFDQDYNLFYLTHIGFIFDTFYNTLAAWQTVTSDDANSVSANPLFNTDWTLQEGSPAINAGTNLGYTVDFNGDPIVGAADVGAFEYQGTSYESQQINLAIEGHSFVAPGTFCATYLPGEGDVAYLNNLAVGGTEIEDIETRAATLDSYLVTETVNLKNVLVLWVGVNDLSYIVGEGATHYALLKSYVQDRIAAGWTVFAYTITPSDAYGRGVQFEIERNVYNNLMRTDLDLIPGVYVLNTDGVPELVDIDDPVYWPPEGSPPGALHPGDPAAALASQLFGVALAEYWNGEENPIPVTDSGIMVSGGKPVVSNNKLVVNP